MLPSRMSAALQLVAHPVGKLRKVSVFRNANCSSNPCDCRAGRRGAKCSYWSPWPMDFCSPGFLPRCSLLVGSCCFIGANAPTGACGGPKCPSLACAGPSVGCGKPILHAWRAGTPIVGALTLPGPSALYPGGPPFGTSADLCSKTLL